MRPWGARPNVILTSRRISSARPSAVCSFVLGMKKRDVGMARLRATSCLSQCASSIAQRKAIGSMLLRQAQKSFSPERAIHAASLFSSLITLTVVQRSLPAGDRASRAKNSMCILHLGYTITMCLKSSLQKSAQCSVCNFKRKCSGSAPSF